MAIINQGKFVVSGKVEELLHGEALSKTEIRANPLERAREIVSKLTFVEGVEMGQECLYVTVAEERVPEITRKLVEQGVEVNAIIPSTSLEAYFLSLTEDES
jgi:ABC-type multidrug transport system ATPase subunit